MDRREMFKEIAVGTVGIVAPSVTVFDGPASNSRAVLSQTIDTCNFESGPLRKKGRVYAVDADTSKGEITNYCNRSLFLLGWNSDSRILVPGVYRVEFDDDTDEGLATVFAYLNLSSTIEGTLVPVLGPGNDPTKITYRQRVAIVRWDDDTYRRTWFPKWHKAYREVAASVAGH